MQANNGYVLICLSQPADKLVFGDFVRIAFLL